MKTLLVVSGGDAPGINAVLFQWASLAQQHGDQVFGAVGGFAGALAGQVIDLEPDLLAPFAGVGGSFLASSRAPVLKDPSNCARLAERLSARGIDCVVLMGGDGTLRHIPPLLAKMGAACVGIPTTIDNDVPGTEQTLGFDTACNFAHQTIDNLLATARALPGRMFSVETLGGNTGFIALDVAWAAGAHAALVPEYAYDENWLVERLRSAVQRDRYALVVLSEGVAASRTLVTDLKARAGLQIRDTRLGHGQRGGPPSHRDRLLAAHLAHTAYHALRSGLKTGVVVVNQDQVSIREGTLAGLPPRLPDETLYRRINSL